LARRESPSTRERSGEPFAARRASLAWSGADDGASAADADVWGTMRFAAHEAAFEVAMAEPRGGRGGRGGGGRRGGDPEAPEGLLSDRELAAIEEAHPDGITAAQVVDIFVSRGLRFSEATFRKYVQQGLLPRSRRVGRKGKHRGSLGVYPAKTVRRVNTVKRLMEENYTIEEIQQQVLRFTDVIEAIEDGLDEVFARLDEAQKSERLDAQTRRELKRDVGEARRVADELRRRLDGLARRAAEPRGDRYGSAGAAGSAEDLL
jgi:DNA-binding transcriptional MerR regulator